MMAKRKTNRTRVSSFYKKDYDYTMDELDLYIEEFMLATRKTLNGRDAALLMNSVLASYNISKKRKLTIEMNYYCELLSKLIKTYGH